MTLTLSEKATARLTAAATQCGMDAEELLLTLLDEQEQLAHDEQPEVHDALTEAFAEIEAGQDISFEQYQAEREAFWQKRGKSLVGK